MRKHRWYSCLSERLSRACKMLFAMVFLVLFSFSSTEAQDANALKAAKVKAAFLYNFIKFVEWPERSPSTTQKATICIAGSHPFENALDTLKAQLAGKIELSISMNSTAASLGDCHILFIGPGATDSIPEMVTEAKKHNVLTVSESNDFAEKGGVIEMKTVEKTIGLFSSNKINLRINLKAAEASSLRVNAQLLEIAAEVIK